MPNVFFITVDDLLVQPWAAVEIAIEIDGKPVSPDQRQQATRWTLARYDLRNHRGQSILIHGTRKTPDGGNDAVRRTVPMEAWLVADRQPDVEPEDVRRELPFAISQRHRRITQNVIPKTPI